MSNDKDNKICFIPNYLSEVLFYTIIIFFIFIIILTVTAAFSENVANIIAVLNKTTLNFVGSFLAFVSICMASFVVMFINLKS